MTKEEQFVVNPVIRWLKSQRAQWKIRKPSHATAATRWDIEAQRKNLDLVIEAKYIDGPFLASFGGLVTAPLAKRAQHFVATKYRNWCYYVCWAIGTSYVHRNVYQTLFDYLTRNPVFWRHYAADLRMKYVFFVKVGRVTKIPFRTLLRLADAMKRKPSVATCGNAE